MALPVVAFAREPVTLSDGQVVQVRGLSRGEVLGMEGVEVARTIEVRLVSYGLDATIEEAEAWYDATPSEDIDAIVTAVSRMSKLEPGADRPT